MTKSCLCQSAWRTIAAGLLGFVLMAGSASAALITGGTGNEPLKDPGWPEHAAAVFNSKSRVAWWEGPPFGGGEYHAECRGDQAELQRVFNDFAKIDAPVRRVVLHDGTGKSFWLNPNDEPANRDAARIDWTFTVWVPNSYVFQQKLPERARPPEITESSQPVPTLDVYVSEKLAWEKLIVPKGIEVVDKRAKAAQ
ncbi:MAG: hypothetical protein KF777_06510 [Planctomycetaceae bacterium]|nr:hypothetical protein [Planctomycetaceae bacterium]